jgi:hypothetical protein
MAIAAARTSRVVEHRFYYAVSIGLAVVVMAGFARTYYLKGLFGAPPLPLLLHIHGAVMTLWYVLFLVQVRLVATHRVALHRKLGVAGVFLAGLVAALGTTVSLGLAKRALLAHADSNAVLLLLAFQLLAIVLVFVILVSLAVYLRRRPDYHKRLMVLAMLSVLGPALTRLPLPFIANHDVPVAIAMDISCVLVCVIADTIRNRRLHPAFGWGGTLVIGSIFVVAAFAQSSYWIRIGRWLLN